MTDDLVQVSRAELEYLRQVKERAEELLEMETQKTQADSIGRYDYNIRYYARLTLRAVLENAPKNP